MQRPCLSATRCSDSTAATALLALPMAIDQAFFGGDVKAARFWKGYFKDSQKAVFSDFVEAYERTLGRRVSSAQRLAMRRHLDYNKLGDVTLEDFRDFLERCGPFVKCAQNCLTKKPVPRKAVKLQEIVEPVEPAAAPTNQMWQGSESRSASVASQSLAPESEYSEAISAASVAYDPEQEAKATENAALSLLHKAVLRGGMAEQSLQQFGLDNESRAMHNIVRDAAGMEHSLVEAPTHPCWSVSSPQSYCGSCSLSWPPSAPQPTTRWGLGTISPLFSSPRHTIMAIPCL